MATVEEIRKLLSENNTIVRGNIKEDIDKAKQDILTSIDSTLASHQKQIDSLKNKVSNLEENDDNRKKIELQKEIKERKHNIIFDNVKESEDSQTDLLKHILELLKEAIDDIQAVDIDFIYRLGKKKYDGKIRPIIVRFICLHRKEAVMNKWKFF